MNPEEMFRKSGAILEGHFILSSGRHSSVYWEKFKVMQYPQYVQQLCGMIADHYRKESIDLVAGPTTAGIILAFEVARQMGVREFTRKKQKTKHSPSSAAQRLVRVTECWSSMMCSLPAVRLRK